MRIQSLQNEDGAVLILSLLLLSVSIIFITGMNRIVYNNSHRFTKDKKQEQAKSLAKAGLEKTVGELQAGELVLGELPAENLGSMGSYKIDSQLAVDGSVIINSTGQVDDTSYQLSTIEKAPKTEKDTNQFSNLDKEDNWNNVKGNNYTITFEIDVWFGGNGELTFKDKNTEFNLEWQDSGFLEAEINLMTRQSDKYYDFNPFSQWLDLKIEVNDNKIKVFLENNLILESTDLGTPTGITDLEINLSGDYRNQNLPEQSNNDGFEILPNEGDDGVLKLTGKQHYYKNVSYDYDPNKVYRVETRIKQESEDGTFYLGVQGLDSSDNLVNIAGENKHEDQYYMSLDNIELKAGSEWKTFVGYFSGQSTNQNKIEKSVDNNPRSAIILNPMPLRNDVAKFRPVFIANNQGGAGITRIDYLKIEQLEINKN